MREIVERETFDTSYAGGKSVFCSGELWAFRPQGWRLLHLCCKWCTFSFAGQHQFALLDKTPREGGSLGCVIALERYSAGDWGFRSACFRARLIGCYGIVRCTMHAFCAVSFLYSLNSALPRLGCWLNGFNRPVLKHGPRSLTYMQVFGWQTHARNESERRCDPQGAASTDLDIFG